MAKKSSLIDATLTMGGLSEVFTQDLEDMSKFPDPTPDRIGPDRAAKLRDWADAQGIAWPHLVNAAKKYHGVEDLADLTDEQARALFEHLKTYPKGNGDTAQTPARPAKAPETAQAPSQAPDAHKETAPVPEPQSSAPGSAEASLFPPVDGGAKARYEDLVKTAKGLGIYPEAKAGQPSLNRLVRECWANKAPDVEIWQIPVEVYDRVDARLTEIAQSQQSQKK